MFFSPVRWGRVGWYCPPVFLACPGASESVRPVCVGGGAAPCWGASRRRHGPHSEEPRTNRTPAALVCQSYSISRYSEFQFLFDFFNILNHLPNISLRADFLFSKETVEFCIAVLLAFCDQHRRDRRRLCRRLHRPQRLGGGDLCPGS